MHLTSEKYHMKYPVDKRLLMKVRTTTNKLERHGQDHADDIIKYLKVITSEERNKEQLDVCSCCKTEIYLTKWIHNRNFFKVFDKFFKDVPQILLSPFTISGRLGGGWVGAGGSSPTLVLAASVSSFFLGMQGVQCSPLIAAY